MNSEQQAELLIRIDERLRNVDKTVKKINETRPVCLKQLATHTERLDTHSKMIWGTWATVLSTLGGTLLIGFKLLFSRGPTP